MRHQQTSLLFGTADVIAHKKAFLHKRLALWRAWWISLRRLTTRHNDGSLHWFTLQLTCVMCRNITKNLTVFGTLPQLPNLPSFTSVTSPHLIYLKYLIYLNYLTSPHLPQLPHLTSFTSITSPHLIHLHYLISPHSLEWRHLTSFTSITSSHLIHFNEFSLGNIQ